MQVQKLKTMADLKNVLMTQIVKISKLFVDTTLGRLITSSKFYYALIIPLFLSMWIYLVHAKCYVVFLSALLGLSLLPMYYTLVEIAEEIKVINSNKDNLNPKQ